MWGDRHDLPNRSSLHALCAKNAQINSWLTLFQLLTTHAALMLHKFKIANADLVIDETEN